MGVPQCHYSYRLRFFPVLLIQSSNCARGNSLVLQLKMTGLVFGSAGHATEPFEDWVAGHGEIWSAQMLAAAVRKVQFYANEELHGPGN